MGSIQIIKTLFHKFYIHPLTILLILLVIFTGLYKEFLIVFSIVIIHEFGHLFSAVYYKWNIDKISIYPYGGCVSFNEKINRPIKEELIILVMGPIVQIVYFLIVYLLFMRGFIDFKTFGLFKTYNFTLLSFNLMPIYPLDGGRIVNVFSNYLFSYRWCNLIICFISVFFIFLVVIYSYNINLVMMMVFVLTEVFVFFFFQGYLYNKFLLERYLDDYGFSKYKIIRNKNGFYRDRRHIIYIDNEYVTEKDYLRRRYK